jgi:phosphonate transport system ATP-binding protein
MIFQHFNLIPRHTVLSNVLMGRLGHTGTLKSIFGWFSDEDKAAARKYLELVGIQEKAKLRADSLSGGQQQRVAIARALIHQPGVLVADEPTGNLDTGMSGEIFRLLESVNASGTTVFVATHDTELIRRKTYRVLGIHGGEVKS